MKKSIQITLKDQTPIQFEATVKTTSDTFVKVHELQDGTSPFFLQINHQQIITFLKLSEVSPFVLLYFNEELDFIGATYSINNGNGSFGIKTQVKRILFMSHPIDFKLEDVLRLNIDMEKNKTLTEAEVSAIATKYIHNYDKLYRMHSGISSSLKNYNNGIITLEIHNSETTKASDFNTAREFALKWACRNTELKQAEGFMVYFYKTVSTGFSIPLEGADDSTLQKLVSELKETKPTKLIGIYSGLLSEEEIVGYFKEHSAK